MRTSGASTLAVSPALFGLVTTSAAIAAPSSAWEVNSTVESWTDFRAKYAFTHKGEKQFVNIACGSNGIIAGVKLAWIDVQVGGRQLTYRVDSGTIITIAGEQESADTGGIVVIGGDALDLARALDRKSNRLKS